MKRPTSSPATRLATLAAAACGLFSTQSAAGAGNGLLPGLTPFFERHCLDCHDGDSRKGGLDLTSLPLGPGNPEALQKWVQLFDRVAEHEMPPPKKTQPAEKERAGFLHSLKGVLTAQCAEQERGTGRVHARRLTRAELERCLQDVLGIDTPLQTQLPEDILTDGFASVAEGQQISSHQLQTFLEGIDAALEDAFGNAQKPRTEWSKKFGWQDLQRNATGPVNSARGAEGRPGHQDVVAWNASRLNEFYGRMDRTRVPADGWYRIRIEAQAVNPPGGRRVCASVFGGKHVSTAPERYLIGAVEAGETPGTFEFVSWMEKDDLLKVRVSDGSLPRRSAAKHPQNREVIENLDGKGYAGVAVRSVTMERLDPGPGLPWQRLFGALAPASPAPAKGARGSKAGARTVPAAKDPAGDIRTLTLAFASRAYRRPVQPAEMDGHVRLALARIEAGASFPEALRSAYRGILLSPKFLYLDETPGPLNAHALATRLSLFLWGAPPDDALRAAADSGRLLDPVVLHAEAERLMAHPNVERFIRGFTDQWLKLGEIDATTPDEKLYDEFDDLLKAAMLGETRAFSLDLLREDRGVGNLVDADHTFVDNRLASHYGIPPLPGPGLQRVALDPRLHRGGILTHASVLKVTANGTTTSPVTRGVWLLEKIIGQRVGPPPPGVPAIEPDIRGAKTIRDQLEKHRADESCAGCHRKIDPPGFVLERYDVIGGWREHYRAVSEKGARKQGPAVEPGYRTADGGGYADLMALKKDWLRHPDAVARTLVRHLVTYSTGASPSFADRDRIRQVVAAAEGNGYGVRTLIHALIQSPIFRNK